MKDGERVGGKEVKGRQGTRAASVTIAIATKLPTYLSVNISYSTALLST